MSTSIYSDSLSGFLAVREIPQAGYVGGLLLVNTWGRPIEFHCSAPVMPTKTQQVLYGSTLPEFMQVEVIARALVQQVKRAPFAILIDESHLARLADWIALPVLLVADNPLASRLRFDLELNIGEYFVRQVLPESQSSSLALNPLGPQLNGHSVEPDHRQALAGPLELLGSQLPLTEPFERIRQAIEEAHGGLSAAA